MTEQNRFYDQDLSNYTYAVTEATKEAVLSTDPTSSEELKLSDQPEVAKKLRLTDRARMIGNGVLIAALGVGFLAVAELGLDTFDDQAKETSKQSEAAFKSVHEMRNDYSDGTVILDTPSPEK